MLPAANHQMVEPFVQQVCSSKQIEQLGPGRFQALNWTSTEVRRVVLDLVRLQYVEQTDVGADDEAGDAEQHDRDVLPEQPVVAAEAALRPKGHDLDERREDQR